MPTNRAPAKGFTDSSSTQEDLAGPEMATRVLRARMSKAASTMSAPVPSPARTRKRPPTAAAQVVALIDGSPADALNASPTEPKTSKRRKSNPAPAKPAAPTQAPIPQASLPAGLPVIPPSLSFQLSDAIAHLCSHDARFAGMFRHLPCKPFQPPLSVIEPFRRLVTSIVGQQVSWMAAKAINGRFRALYGFADEDEGFPMPEVVAKSEVVALKGVGLSTRKAEYALAEHFATGTLSSQLLQDGADEEVAKALIAVRGIGQWTVDMFLMFSLRRPDVLPVGDLGVQKGLLRWALAAHGALKAKGKISAQSAKKYGLDQKLIVHGSVNKDGQGEIDTLVKERQRTPEPTPKRNMPPTPFTPNDTKPQLATLHTPGTSSGPSQIPPTPATPLERVRPDQTLVVDEKELPPPAPDVLLAAPTEDPLWDAHRSCPLDEGLSVELLKARLAGKKAKGGAYLTPKEMEVLTDGWRPYRSLGVYYMWPAAEDF